ncbi:MAG: glycosyltransferase family 92 protein [Alphaproteobacteria bacterium]|nr:glycosyltransferase family 92 protein [Alphaproteobacteria bacterium]
MIELAACAIFRDEARHLAEWLAFHRLVGVERFFLYDNGSIDDWQAAITASGIADAVTVTSWPLSPGQRAAYDDCLFRFGPQARWIAFIDCDEFLFATDGADLRETLAHYAEWPGVGVNQIEYGASGHRRRPSGPVTRNYVRRGAIDLRIGIPAMLRRPGLDPEDAASYRPQFTWVRSVVQPVHAVQCRTPQSFAYRDGARAVAEDGTPLDGSWSERVSVERLRINHYWSRSLEDLAEKVARGSPDGPPLALPRALDKESRLNTETDTAIFPIAARLPGWRA